MKNSILVEIIGKPFSVLQSKSEYPILTPAMLNQRNCLSFVHQLPGLPVKSEAMKKRIVQLILSGEILELEEQQNNLHVVVCFIYRSEKWMVSLDQYGQAWSIGELYYHGKLASGFGAKKYLFVGGAIAFLGVAFLGYSYFSNLFEAQISSEVERPVKIANTHSEQRLVTPGTSLEQQDKELEGQNETYPTIPVDLDDAPNAGETGLLDSLEQQEGVELEKLDDPKGITDTPQQVDEYFVLNIEPGMSGIAVARLLEQQGHIGDQYELIDLLKSLEVQAIIQTGAFTIPKHASHSDIIRIITEK
ncbi:hypothetical protein [Bacillus horti]|uniref:Uncharacterized protein n=1 Tax=Caldalkalibacillus horti TaxID=77523 RepID=A0ABT9W4B6_9BACI|nr:hypothetical protein [Bacillus horti]MDQ0168083.1 hypothetical protein [Bacillus horti]